MENKENEVKSANIASQIFRKKLRFARIVGKSKAVS